MEDRKREEWIGENLEHLPKWCRPKIQCYPTHSAKNAEMDGAQKSTAKEKMLQSCFVIDMEWRSQKTGP
jgi:hypothetical protein